MSTTVWFLCSDRSLVWSSSLWSLAKFTNTYKKKNHHPGFSSIQDILYTRVPELVLGFRTLLKHPWKTDQLISGFIPTSAQSSFWQRLLKTYLVKCGLRNGVVFYVESLFVLGENTKYSGQGGRWRGKLVLQHISMFFLQNTSREGMTKELLNRLQVWVCPCNSHHYGVTISKPVKKRASTGVKCLWKRSAA